MLKKALFTSFMTFFSSLSAASIDFSDAQKEMEKQIVVSTKQIKLADFTTAHNPSIIDIEEGYLMTFRFCPDPFNQYWLSYIGIVLLDDSFELISEPQLLSTRLKHSKAPSQSEDARIFYYRGRIFVLYNDNLEILNPQTGKDAICLSRNFYMIIGITFSLRH